MAYKNITHAGLVHLKGLTYLENLNLDSCRVGDDEMECLRGLTSLKNLDLSDSEVGGNGLQYLAGLQNLKSLNLSFTQKTYIGLQRLSGLTTLKSLNLDAQVTESGWSALTGLHWLDTSRSFGARIFDYGTSCERYFKKLQSSKLCGGSITHVESRISMCLPPLVIITQLNGSKEALNPTWVLVLLYSNHSHSHLITTCQHPNIN